MKGFMSRLGQKLGQAADSIAAYNGDYQQSNGSHGGSPRVPSSQAAVADDVQADPVLEHLLRNVRSRHVRTQFFKTAPAAYTTSKDVRVLVGSYNVNGKKPAPGLDMKEWLGAWAGEWPAGEQGDTQLPDIVVVGFQEIVALNAGNVMIGSATENLEGWDLAIGGFLNGEAWAAQQSRQGADVASAVQAGQVLGSMDTHWQGGGLSGAGDSAHPARASPRVTPVAAGAEGPGMPHSASSAQLAGRVEGGWVHIAARQLVGAYLTVWARRSLLPHIRGVQATVTMTGFGGWAGNKGAVVVRMRVYDSPLVVVCAHLSAGEQEGDELRRNGDVSEILRRTDFSACGDGPGAMSSPTAALISSSLGVGYWGGLNGVTDHGSAIWVGDLNYRLSAAVLSDDDARKALRAGRLDTLLQADQLRREMAAGRVFNGGWREGPITFPPTFKFKVGTHTYLGEAGSEGAPEGGNDPEELAGEAGGKQKRRTPAWCDRVLWLNAHGCLHQLSYRRGELCASDHKPVAAAFLMQARHYDRSKVDGVLQDARRAVDLVAALQRPKCTLEPNQVVVPQVLAHGAVWRTTVKLVNTGSVEGVWHWVPPPSGLGLDDEGSGLPAWLTSYPTEGVVPAGGACEVTLEVCVEGGPQGAAAHLAAGGTGAPPPTGRGGRGGAQGPNTAAVPAGPQLALGAQVPLDAIVICRVEDGGDMFLCVNGSAAVSFLGSPLSALLSRAPPCAASAATGQLLGELMVPGCVGLPCLTRRMVAACGLPPDAPPTGSALVAHVPGPWAALLAGLLTQSAASPQAPATVAAGLLTSSALRVLHTGGGEVPAAAAHAAQHGGCDAAVWGDRACVRAVLHRLSDLTRAVEAASATSAGQDAGRCEALTSAGPHALAALLGAALVELPHPLLPVQLSELCNTHEPGLGVADRVLSSSLRPAEAGLLVALRGLLLRVLAAGPAAGDAGGWGAVRECLAVLLMSPPRQGAAGTEVAGRRAGLIARLMLPPAGYPVAVPSATAPQPGV